MKNLKLFLTAAICFLLVNCDPAEQYPVSFKYNGTSWYAVSSPAIVTGGKLYINANSTNQAQNPISMTLTQYTVLDTFDLDSATNAFLFGQSFATGYYAKSSNPAKIIIKEYNAGDKHVVADFYGWLFNFNHVDSVLITDGRFDLRYQE